MQSLLLIMLGAAIGAAVPEITKIGIARWRRRHRVHLALYGWEDVQKWGWTSKKLLTCLIALDKKVMGTALTDAREGSVTQWAPVFQGHPQTWLLLATGAKRIVGYWHFIALEPATLARTKAGELLDSEVTNDVTVPMEAPGFYNVYFTQIGILPEFRYALGKLTSAFFDRMQKMAEEGIFFEDLCTNAFTKDGDQLCVGFGLVRQGPHRDFGTVYCMSFNPWPRKLRHRRWQQLQELYQSAFQEAHRSAK